jgi:23S rRNA (adenine2030-N6)-methyltransferase
MLSYQHGYHAGNFADVVKHLTLSRILCYAAQKNKPLFYLDTHSGRGLYDLKDSQAMKTGEYLQGINLLWQHRHHLPALFSPYLHCIDKINTGSNLRFYPGSPALAIELLRTQDRLYFCELHPQEFTCLENLKRENKRVFYSHTDGIASLKALLPPVERRGVIFIDPSFEVKDEYKTIPRAIKTAHEKFSTGIYCAWYPLVDRRLSEQFLRGMKAIPATCSLHIEFNMHSNTELGMSGCGLWIINPPFTLKAEMEILLKQWQALCNPLTPTFQIKSEY